MINNARRFSIYIKNVPQEKFNNVEIDTFFSNFGEVVRVDRHLEKQAATVKFKDVESAEKAAASWLIGDAYGGGPEGTIGVRKDSAMIEYGWSCGVCGG